MSDKILLVDDDLDLLESFRESLDIRGYHTLTATNGLEAIETYTIECPCIVFMDIKMPKMDGYEAVREMKGTKQPNKFPFLCLPEKIKWKIYSEWKVFKNTLSNLSIMRFFWGWLKSCLVNKRY